MTQRRWTVWVDGSDMYTKALPGWERVEVVPADDQLTVEELKRLSYAVGVPVGAEDARLFAKLRRLAGRTR